MIGGFISMAAAALAVIGADAPAAKPADVAKTYDIHVVIEQDGKVYAKPRLVAKAGQAAAFVQFAKDDHIGMMLAVTAKPDAASPAGPDGVSLALDLVVQPNAAEKERTISTVVVKLGEPVVIQLAAHGASPATRVEVSANLLLEKASLQARPFSTSSSSSMAASVVAQEHMKRTESSMKR